MKLSIIFPLLNQHPLSQTAIDFAINNLSGEEDVGVIIMDNGSDVPFEYKPLNDKVKVQVLTNAKNIGVYPVFWEVLKWAGGDILAFFHSDLIICEKGWDKRLMDAWQQSGTDC